MTAPVTLHREINALGGVPHDEYGRGRNDAIGEVLAILEARGFTEAADAPGDGGWIEWAGGECPVKPDILVQRRYRALAWAGNNPAPAAEWDWRHSGAAGDIIAYRIVEAA